MKRVFFKSIATTFASMALFTSSVVASDLVVPVGVIVMGNSVEVAVAPSSVIIVDLTSESVSFEPGVYARYAQKYLGVRASLMAKSSTQITSAKISKVTEGERSMMSSNAVANVDLDIDDSMLPIDLTSAVALSPEEAAERAAEEIFRIRRLRKELLSGDLGEGFYGGGLQAALTQFEREEREYTKLFMGHTERKSDRHSFTISISGGDKRYVVCRFSQSEGVVGESDLSAEPIMLKITPSGSEQIVAPAPTDKSEIRKFRVADMSKCELLLGSKLLAQSTMSLFEFGYDLNYPIIKR